MSRSLRLGPRPLAAAAHQENGRVPIHRLLLVLAAGIALASPAAAATCDVTAFGARGDGATLATAALQRAIDACRDQGGGRVVVPAGVFVTGTLRLHSRIELHLETGAVLRGSPRLPDYQLDGRRLGLLYAENAEGVSVTGPGTIDGNSDAFMDRTAAKRIDPAQRRLTRQKERFREVASGLGDGPYVPLDRPFQMLLFSGCRNVTLEDVTILNAPFWAVHFADCDSVRVRGVRLFNDLMVPNGDGIDFTSCTNVVVSDCDVRAGDDALVFTGYDRHFDLPGFTGARRDSENVVVTNCTLQSRSSAIRIGGYDQNAMRNYSFSNIVIHGSNRGIGVFQREAGSIENVTFSNVVIRTRLHTGDWWGNGEPIHVSAVRVRPTGPIGRIRGLKFSHVVATGESGILVFGTPESVIEDVTFENVDFRLEAGPLQETSGGNVDLRLVADPKLQLFARDIPAFLAQHVKNLRLRDVTLAWGDVTQPFFSNGLEVAHYDGLTVEGLRADAAPSSRGGVPVRLRDGRGARVGEVRSARGR
jgi:polygalacturonase